MKIKTKKHKKWRYVYRKFGITQRFKIETPKRAVRLESSQWKKLHMGRYYEGSHVLFLESRA